MSEIHDLAISLRNSQLIVAKVKANPVYAQHLYAALCNNDFYEHSDILELLKDSTWSCSWRASGEIVSELQGFGDYLNWYCSGIRGTDKRDNELYITLTPEQQAHYIESSMYVEEGTITEEVSKDLYNIGWMTVKNS